MKSFSDIELFATIARLGNMARAAQELGVTPPVVSRTLAALEKRLGVRLMNRTTRTISLTQEGEIYLTEGAQILESLQSLEARLSGGKQPQGTVKVAASLGFGRIHLAPALSQFAREYPKVNIQLHLTDKLVNLADQGFDAVIRFGEPADSQLTARLLANNRRMVCAAPAYLKVHGEPQHPRDLAKHNCIFVRQADETFGTWHLHNAAQHETIKVRSRLTTNDGSSALAWALDGQGILIRSQWEIAQYLRSRRLVQVLPDWQPAKADIFLVFQVSQPLPAKLRVLVDWLLVYFKERRQPIKAAHGPW